MNSVRGSSKTRKAPNAWAAVERALRSHYYEPDIQAARILYSAVAAHGLSGPPVWLMEVAPPGSLKTELVETLRTHPGTHLIDSVTPKTFLSGQIVEGPAAHPPGLLERVGSDAILIYPDFSTVLAMRPENRAAVLADMRRIYDGHLRKEFGTTESVKDWYGRVTFIAAATPEVDRYYSIFQTLGERFIMVRWGRPAGVEAALCAMNQNQDMARAELGAAVHALLKLPAPTEIRLSTAHQRQLAALTELIVRARTHTPRERSKEIVYIPEPEGATRLAQQLCQLAKGSARLARRTTVNVEDLAVAQRAAFDCVTGARRRILTTLINGDDRALEDIPTTSLHYAYEELRVLGLIRKQKTGGHVLSDSARHLVRISQFHTLSPPSV